MNLDELQSVQARERQSSDLQHLRSSFYREVGEYVDELTDRRSALVAEAEDPFSAPEVRQLSDDVETAEQTVEAIYERRVGKVVKKASIAAAGMPVDDDGLTAEEEALFESLVDRIERNRETVLSVLDGETPSVQEAEAPDAKGSDSEGSDAKGSDEGTGAAPGEPAAGPDETGASGTEDDAVEPGGVDAADLMGGAGDEPDTETGAAPAARAPGEPEEPEHDASPTEVAPDAAPPGGPDPDRPDGDQDSDARHLVDEEGQHDDDETGTDTDAGGAGDASRGDEPTSGSPDATTGDDEPTSGHGDVPGIPRTTVRITADVGEVVGADNRDYDLGPEDVVTLPEANADVLVEKDAAERLE